MRWIAESLAEQAFGCRGIAQRGLERIAYHEAGHATLALVEGLGLRSASIEPDPAVYTDWRRRDTFAPTPRQYARFFIGGFCAELQFAPKGQLLASSSYDFANARRKLGERDHWFPLLPEVNAAVASHWPLVERIAQALLERGTLTGREIEWLR